MLMMALPTSEQAPQDTGAALEVAVDEVIAACDGDARAAVRALMIAIGFHEDQMQAQQEEIAALTAAVSRGYARGRFYATRKKALKRDQS